MGTPPQLPTEILEQAVTIRESARREFLADDGFVDAAEASILDGLDRLTTQVTMLKLRREIGRAVEDGAAITPEILAFMTPWQQRKWREAHRDLDIGPQAA